MASSVASAAPRPPSTLSHLLSLNPTFSGGSWRRDGTSTGRMLANRARSVTRAERLADRTAANVAPASTSVPPAVASAEIVTQSALNRSSTDARCSIGEAPVEVVVVGTEVEQPVARVREEDHPLGPLLLGGQGLVDHGPDGVGRFRRGDGALRPGELDGGVEHFALRVGNRLDAA